MSADPNNLPFTNVRREGFENKIADLVAEELGVELKYTWRAQRRGCFREALKEGEADVVLGMPAGFDMAATTAPYYRSTYVFVTRTDRKLDLTSLDDPRLKTLRIGVQVVGDDGANAPPVHALSARGAVGNLVGFTLDGDYREANPPARVIEAVAAGDVDAAIAWGPRAGYPAMALSLVATAFIGFGVWVHHMFATPLPRVGQGPFTGASLMIAVPNGVQIICWVATMIGGKVRLKTPMLFVLGFFATLVIGGLAGVMLASVSIDRQVRDTFFVAY